jgi:type IV pilus biogenesis protein CpaD/CtpE
MINHRTALKSLTTVVVALGLSGCTADYMSRDESISPDLGNAMAINTALQVVNPQPLAAYDTQVAHAGATSATAVTALYSRPAGNQNKAPSTSAVTN